MDDTGLDTSAMSTRELAGLPLPAHARLALVLHRLPPAKVIQLLVDAYQLLADHEARDNVASHPDAWASYYAWLNNLVVALAQDADAEVSLHE